MKKVETALIVEDEVHLAQSIANALTGIGYHCQVVSSIFHNFKEDYDVVLISAKVCVDRCAHFVRKNSDSITIMMTNFISEDSVNRPLQAGAKDYILKPFKMEDLIRRINYHKAYKEILNRVRLYDKYLDAMITQRNFSPHMERSLPLIIRSHTQNNADIFALHYARTHHLNLEFISLKDVSLENIQGTVYATHLEALKPSERDRCLKILGKRNAIISFVGVGSLDFENVIDLEDHQEMGMPLELLSIQDYEKNAIVQFSPCYTDTELAKHLGISRKSLWEKRRRYNLPRKSNV
ncbi:response regulator [Helicobacter felis]|uniref:Possible two-component regulator/Response regulator n=1 Tax=Helicobacter felis (strain ATCC 49179 / CCUG 28539 / NCTC 12436 / CS1) TaxID=936155 RepID=E7AD43_HELFC|nr:response regulator [Helicobacter felis]CBY82308.1 possible two-component regulator/Response regulator [Helicobacter felis ATCC 49179]